MDPSPDPRPAMKWYVLAVMTAVYAINIADRFVVSTLIDPIKREFALSDAGVGMLTGVSLAIFYVAAGIPLGLLADRVNRTRMVAIALATWSLLTAACGMSRTFWQLLMLRIGVGVGEAGGTPPSQSLLADYFRPAQRGMAMSLYALGAALGAALGSSLGGAIADHQGWRAVLVTFGLLGLPLALLVVVTVREPARGRCDAQEPAEATSPTIAQTLRFIAGSPPLRHLLAGATVLTFAGWGVVWWVPTVLLRSHGLSLEAIGADLGWMHGVGGALVTLTTAMVMGRLARDGQRRQLRFVALFTLAATLPATAAFSTQLTPLTLAMLWAFVPSTYLYIGPTLAAAQNLVPATMRALICAVILFVCNIANLVVAPVAIGAVSDLISPYLADPADALRHVLTVAAASGLWASWHYAMAARALDRISIGTGPRIEGAT